MAPFLNLNLLEETENGGALKWLGPLSNFINELFFSVM